MAAHPTPSDARKMGYLIKLKTMKKKLFILRDQTTGPARLEYYDNDKSFKRSNPKRTIPLKNCFSINATADSKNKYAIALHTRDDCFTVVCDSESEQEEWLGAMLELQNETRVDGEPPRLSFEHVWSINIKPKGLGNGPILSAGQYRLCLTSSELSIIRLNQDQPKVVFLLTSIRRCGHTDNYFYMEVGSAALTGAGELWMQVEDTVIARNMHDTIRSSMENNSKNKKTQPSVRRRQTISEKPSRHPRYNKEHSTPALSESSNPTSQPEIARAHTISVSRNDRSPVRRRHSHSPNKPVQQLRPNTVYRDTSSGWTDHRHSPINNSPFSYTLDDPRARADSIGSHGSRRTDSSFSDDYDGPDVTCGSSGPGSTRSVTPDRSIQEEPADYLDMALSNKDHGTHGNTGQDLTPHPLDNYMDMQIGSVHHSNPKLNTEKDGYVDMSPGSVQNTVESSYLEMTRASPAVSSASSQDIEESSYLDMAPTSRQLAPVQEKLDGGYLDMSPGTCSPNITPTSSVRLDKVYSYLAEDNIDDFPKRANSVGSKPIVTKKPLNESYAYMDMSGGASKGTVDKTNPRSCSAPHLPANQQPGHSKHQESGRKRFHDRKKAEFMEFDFNNSSHKNNDDFRPRTASGGSRDFRPRTSSLGQSESFRRRTNSFGCQEVTKTRPSGSMRPRTSTIGQDSLRPRTSSFGTSDMRVRSSSHGNARFCDFKMRKDSANASRQSSQESLRRASKMSSLESVSSVNSEYLDMSPKISSSPSQALCATFRTMDRISKSPLVEDESAYISMTPESDNSRISTPPFDLDHGPHLPRSGSGSTRSKNKGQHLKFNTSSSESLSSQGSESASKSKNRKSKNRNRDTLFPNEDEYGEYVDIDVSAKGNISGNTSPSPYMEVSSRKSKSPLSYVEMPAKSSKKSSDNKNKNTTGGANTSDYMEASPGAVGFSPFGAGTISVPIGIQSPDKDVSYVSYEPGENSPAIIAGSLEKIVSPIREDFLELPIAPKPRKILPSSARAKGFHTHEYVNIKLGENTHTGPGTSESSTNKAPPIPPLPTACKNKDKSSDKSSTRQRPDLPGFVIKSPAKTSTEESDYALMETTPTNTNEHLDYAFMGAFKPAKTSPKAFSAPKSSQKAFSPPKSNTLEESDYALMEATPTSSLLDNNAKKEKSRKDKSEKSKRTSSTSSSIGDSNDKKEKSKRTSSTSSTESVKSPSVKKTSSISAPFDLAAPPPMLGLPPSIAIPPSPPQSDSANQLQLSPRLNSSGGSSSSLSQAADKSELSPTLSPFNKTPEPIASPRLSASKSPSDVTSVTPRLGAISMLGQAAMKKNPTPPSQVTDPDYQEMTIDPASSSGGLTFTAPGSQRSSGSMDENKEQSTTPGATTTLNYATLDLSSADDIVLAGNGNKSPTGVAAQKSRNPSTVEAPLPPMSYAQIDFEKSQDLRQAAAVRDDKAPFDCL